METGITKLTPELLAFIGTGGVKAFAPFTREIPCLTLLLQVHLSVKKLTTLNRN